MKSELSAPQLQSEAAAIAFVEAKLWPNGPECPKCGTLNRAGLLNGKGDRPGLWKCYACRKPFTVHMGTIFESSHVPLHIWLQVIYLMTSSKKGFATRQIQRTLSCSMKTAWFLGHRVRECMKELAPLSSAITTASNSGSMTPPARMRHCLVLSDNLVQRSGGAQSSPNLSFIA